MSDSRFAAVAPSPSFMLSLSDLPSLRSFPSDWTPPVPDAWAVHWPLVRDLLVSLRPRSLVALVGGSNGFLLPGLAAALRDHGLDAVPHGVAFSDAADNVPAAVGDNDDCSDPSIRWLWMSSTEAAARFDTASVDWLHVDGGTPDLGPWLPKVRAGGLVLVHGAADRSDPAGSWRVWEQGLPAAGRRFLFTPGRGLGVYERERTDTAPRPSTDEDVGRHPLLEALFGADEEPTVVALRHLYALLGERAQQQRPRGEARSVTVAVTSSDVVTVDDVHRALALHEEAAAERRRAEHAGREATQLRAKLDKSTTALAESDAALAEVLDERADAWRELSLTNDALLAAREALARLARERDAARGEIRAARETSEAVRRGWTTSEQGIVEARDHIARLETALTAERGRVRSMRETLSWRATLPFRALGRAFPLLPEQVGRLLGRREDDEDEGSTDELRLLPPPTEVSGWGRVGPRTDFRLHLDSPTDWDLRTRQVRIAGWCLPPASDAREDAGRGMASALNGVRVVVGGVGGETTEGRYGFPRPDVAGAFGLSAAESSCGFDVDVPSLPAGVSEVALEMRDAAHGEWREVERFRVRTPAGPNWLRPAADLLWGKRGITAPESSDTLGVDTPTNWNVISRNLRIAGWCLPPANGRITGIRAVVGSRVSLGQHGYRRPDLAERYGLPPGREKCGFEVFVDLPGGRSLLKLEVSDEHGNWHVVGRFPVRAPLVARGLPRLPRLDADSIQDYATWVGYYDTFTPTLRRWLRTRAEALADRPLISVVMPVYNTPERYLVQAIDSVRAQVYDRWELCITNDASTQPHVRRVLDGYARRDPRIRVVHRERNGHISAASNSALEIATGRFVALLDHDDELSPAALYAVAEEINAHPDADLIYSDEDKIDPQNRRYGPYFKPDWNPDLLVAQNYLCHLLVLRTEFMRALGGFRVGFEGSQDWDLILRATDRLTPEKIRHIPRVLYHWRAIPGSTAQIIEAKDYVADTSRRMLTEHFERTGQAVRVEEVGDGYWRTRHQLSEPPPLVSIIIPTRNRVELLHRCVEGILADDTYPHYELIVVDNGSDETTAQEYLAGLPARDPRCRVVPYDRPFNYSALNNFAVREHARGEIVLLLNNDMEIITRGWLEELVSQAARPEIGCVGAMLLYPDNTIQHAGVVLGTGGVAGHAFKHFKRDESTHGSRSRLVQNYSAVTAACLAVKRRVFLEVGGLDEEHLTVAFNDVDFCLKVLRTGLRNLWTPFAELYHHESASRGLETTPEKVERFGAEIETMRARWEVLLQNDPAYNPNLTLMREDFSFASPPRMARTWGETAH